MIGLVYATAAGRRHADRLAAAWGSQVRRYDGKPGRTLPAAFGECEAVVAFLATGAAVRLLAPHLGGKAGDPGVVCVDEAARYAVALLGGHAGGGTDLAQRVSGVLGCQPVVTTATDAAGLPGLDTLGWPLDGDLAAVTRAVLDGEPVRLLSDEVWPLPALPPNVRLDADARYAIVISDREGSSALRHGASFPITRMVVLRPPSLVVGVGASRGVSEAEVLDLLAAALAEGGLAPGSVRSLATVDLKGDEPGIVGAAARLGVPLVVHPREVLAGVETPNPSEAVQAAVGVPSVAEASALAGGRAELLVAKRKSAMATVAVARHRPRGRLALVGIGPGARDLLTPRAAEELRRASVVVGLDQYVDQVRDLLRPGTRVLATPLGDEQARARTAVEEARLGHAVALIGSGDAGVYGMAGPALDQAGPDIDIDVDVVGVPGVTAALAAAALLGAPLGHDHVAVSLSDLHTPWAAIEQRVRAAADGDFVVCFYNPRSRDRDWQLPKALAILAERRAPATPVGVVRDASRPQQRVTVTTLADVDVEAVDMHTLVVVGSSQTRLVAGRMVTPRGYSWEA